MNDVTIIIRDAMDCVDKIRTPRGIAGTIREGLVTLERELHEARAEIERLRATPIQWRPVDEVGRSGYVLGKIRDNEFDIVIYRGSQNAWMNRDRDRYLESEVTAYCPLK